MAVKKRILLLPSYWPTHQAPLVGAQVYEQTALLAKEFDYKALYCMPGMGWKRFLWYGFVNFFSGKQFFQSCKSEFLPGKVEVIGIYYFRSKIFSYKKNRNQEFKAYQLLFKKLIKEGWLPDLIHSRTAEFAGVNAARLSKLYNIPFLLTENCIFVLTDNLSVDRIRDYKLAIETAGNVAVVSNYLKAQLLSNNFKCNPVTIGNWIDETKFSIKKKDNPDVFTILNIGHTGFTKDWPTFFSAMKYLVNNLRCRNVKIILAVTHVFDDTSRNYIPSLVREYEVENYCEIFYEVPRNEVVTLYQKADIFVSTSINETFGIATCEAMFCGLPVVATANGGIDDFISAENGIKVEIGDHAAIANAIHTIYSGIKMYDPNKIRQSVLNKYGTESFKKKLISMYNKTIEG